MLKLFSVCGAKKLPTAGEEDGGAQINFINAVGSGHLEKHGDSSIQAVVRVCDWFRPA